MQGGYAPDDASLPAQAMRHSSVDSFLKDGTPTMAHRGSSADAEEVSSVLVPVFDVGTPSGEVTVEHPETQSDKTGMKKFTTFQVSGTLNGNRFTSRKRYSDFVWFRLALASQLPGVFLPSLPGKLKVGRFDNAFIEERSAGLQQFLRRIFQRSEISMGLPLVFRFLNCVQAGFETMKTEIDARPLAENVQEYRRVFDETLETSSPPKSDKGFLMIKGFLEKHVPLLKTAQASALVLIKAQDAVNVRTTEVGRAMVALTEDETDLLAKAQVEDAVLRSKMLESLSESIEIEKSGKAIHTLSASLQREIEDCEAVEESLLSIELLQKRLNATKSKIASDTASRASLKGEAPPDDGFIQSQPSSDALANGMRKRDKTKELFGKMTSAVMDMGAKVGINKEKRLLELERMMEEDTQEVAVLEDLIGVARTVFSATEIERFLRAKSAGCLWAQSEFASQKAVMSQALARCWA